MRLELHNFAKDQVIHVSNEYDTKLLDIDFVDLKYSDKLLLDGTVEKSLDALTFRGNIKGLLEHTCGRCLKQLRQTLNKQFVLYYEIKGREFIDTTDDIRELLILDHPLNFVCQDQCRGLCSECGSNLNEVQCRCKSEQGSEGTFYKLKDIWKKKNRS